MLEGTLTSDKAADGHIGSGRDCPCDLSAIRQSFTDKLTSVDRISYLYLKCLAYVYLHQQTISKPVDAQCLNQR